MRSASVVSLNHVRGRYVIYFYLARMEYSSTDIACGSFEENHFFSPVKSILSCLHIRSRVLHRREVFLV